MVDKRKANIRHRFDIRKQKVSTCFFLYMGLIFTDKVYICF